MGSFEYITALISIIIGLGITHLFVGISRLINNTRGVKIYWIHLLWTFYIFIYMISFWWFEYKYSTLHDLTFSIYLFMIFYAVLLFFLAVINMPQHFPENFKTYFFSSRQWFYIAVISTNFIDIFDSVLKGRENLSSLGIDYVVFMSITFVLLILGMINKKVLVQAIVVIFMNLSQLWFLLSNFRTL